MDTMTHHNFRDPDPWYTISQAAAALGVSKAEIKKKYPYTSVDGVRLFHKDDLGYTPPRVGPM